MLVVTQPATSTRQAGRSGPGHFLQTPFPGWNGAGDEGTGRSQTALNPDLKYERLSICKCTVLRRRNIDQCCLCLAPSPWSAWWRLRCSSGFVSRRALTRTWSPSPHDFADLAIVAADSGQVNDVRRRLVTVRSRSRATLQAGSSHLVFIPAPDGRPRRPGGGHVDECL